MDGVGMDGAGFEGIARALALLEPWAGLGPGLVTALVAVFIRVGAVVAFLPGFGEQMLPMRIRMAVTIAFTFIVFPVLMPGLPVPDPAPMALAQVFLAEAVAGMLLGILMRLMIMVLQLAGSIAAQATSISQIFGTGLTPDPMPAIGNILVIAGIALALAGGLHVKTAAMLAGSYEVLPFGRFPGAGDIALWGTGQVGRAFALSVTLAAPFVILSFLYNVAIGAINRAMPQLMVSFVGAPFITGGALLLFAIAAPVLLKVWLSALDQALALPMVVPR